MQAYCHPNEFGPATHLLYRGLGGCRFEDVSGKAGIAKAPGKGLGVAFQDLNRDGWPDIFVANDSFPQQLFRNKRDGTFEEFALAMGGAYDEDGKVFAGMGVDWADYDNDGLPDVFVNALANQGYQPVVEVDSEGKIIPRPILGGIKTFSRASGMRPSASVGVSFFRCRAALKKATSTTGCYALFRNKELLEYVSGPSG